MKKALQNSIAFLNRNNFLFTDLGKSFRSEPSDTEGDEGRQLLFHCEPPDGYPNPMVTWKRNDEYVNLDSRINIQDGNLFIQKVTTYFEKNFFFLNSSNYFHGPFFHPKAFQRR